MSFDQSSVSFATTGSNYCSSKCIEKIRETRLVMWGFGKKKKNLKKKKPK